MTQLQQLEASQAYLIITFITKKVQKVTQNHYLLIMQSLKNWG